MKFKKGNTDRGFSLIEFQDKNERECSVQDSSSAGECSIWIGVDNTGDHIKGPGGKTNEHVGARMHLTQSMVEELLPILAEFAEKGTVSEIKLKKMKP
jgi:hypothetical protein